MSKKIELVGQKFGRLTVEKEDLERDGETSRICKCECGRTISVRTRHLRRGDTKSCGCLYNETRKTCGKTHGMGKTKIYKVWASLKERCNNKNQCRYKDYGGRGIKCERNSFEEFYKDMGKTYKEGLTIDRIDNDGYYCKENCRRTTYKVQANNKRNSNSVGQYTKEGKLIKIWESNREIERVLGISNQYISECARGLKNGGCGFKRKYI